MTKPAVKRKMNHDTKEHMIRLAMDMFRDHQYHVRDGDARPMPPTAEMLVAAAREFQAFVEE